MYSPRLISRSTPARAWVSTSSVRKTFFRVSRCITLSMLYSFREARAHRAKPQLLAADDADYADLGSKVPYLIQFHAIVGVPVRHVGQDDLISFVQAVHNLDLVDRAPAEFHLYPMSFAVLH